MLLAHGTLQAESAFKTLQKCHMGEDFLLGGYCLLCFLHSFVASSGEWIPNQKRKAHLKARKLWAACERGALLCSALALGLRWSSLQIKEQKETTLGARNWSHDPCGAEGLRGLRKRNLWEPAVRAEVGWCQAAKEAAASPAVSSLLLSLLCQEQEKDHPW